MKSLQCALDTQSQLAQRRRKIAESLSTCKHRGQSTGDTSDTSISGWFHSKVILSPACELEANKKMRTTLSEIYIEDFRMIEGLPDVLSLTVPSPRSAIHPEPNQLPCFRHPQKVETCHGLPWHSMHLPFTNRLRLPEECIYGTSVPICHDGSRNMSGT
jgi:hypothetical protein